MERVFKVSGTARLVVLIETEIESRSDVFLDADLSFVQPPKYVLVGRAILNLVLPFKVVTEVVFRDVSIRADSKESAHAEAHNLISNPVYWRIGDKFTKGPKIERIDIVVTDIKEAN